MYKYRLRGMSDFLMLVWTLLLCATTLRWSLMRSTHESYTDFSHLWKPATCVLRGVQLRKRKEDDKVAAVAGRLRLLAETAGTRQCVLDMDDDSKKGTQVITADTRCDGTRSLTFLDRQFLDCKNTGQVLNSYRYLVSKNSIAAQYNCSNEIQRGNSNVTRRTVFADVRAGLTPHPADCGQHPISALAYESDGSQLRLRFDCATDVIVDTGREKQYHSGWATAADNVDRLDGVQVDCPNGTVLTAAAVKDCDGTGEQTVVYKCAPISVIIAAGDTAEPPAPPRSVYTDVPELTLHEQLETEFAGTRIDLENTAKSFRKLFLHAFAGSMDVAEGVSGVFTGFGKGLVDGFNAITSRVKPSGKQLLKSASLASFRRSFSSLNKIGTAFPKAINVTKKAFVDGWNSNISKLRVNASAAKKDARAIGSAYATALDTIKNSVVSGWGEFQTTVKTIPKHCFENKIRV